MSENGITPPAVVSVVEGDGTLRADSASRTFSVTLTRPAEDLSIVASAADPKTKAAIPAAGSPHPMKANLVARPPMIYAVGLRDARGGAMLATRSPFYNVRVRYVPAAAGA
jgi:hypothetical protein